MTNSLRRSEFVAGGVDHTDGHLEELVVVLRPLRGLQSHSRAAPAAQRVLQRSAARRQHIDAEAEIAGAQKRLVADDRPGRRRFALLAVVRPRPRRATTLAVRQRAPGSPLSSRYTSAHRSGLVVSRLVVRIVASCIRETIVRRFALRPSRKFLEKNFSAGEGCRGAGESVRAGRRESPSTRP